MLNFGNIKSSLYVIELWQKWSLGEKIGENYIFGPSTLEKWQKIPLEEKNGKLAKVVLGYFGLASLVLKRSLGSLQLRSLIFPEITILVLVFLLQTNPTDQAYENSMIYKEKTKKIHDSKIKNRVFNVGDRVLLFNSRLKIFSGKLKTRWTGPFTIGKVYPYGTVELSQADGPNSK